MSLDNNLKKWALRILAYILTAVIIIWMIIIFKNHLGDFRVVKSISANMIFALAITSLLSFFLQGLIFKIIVEPLPINVPLQEPEYQYHTAPNPKVPPVKPNTMVAPGHIIAGNEKMESGLIDIVLTTIEVLTHIVELQIPSALAK